MLEPLSAVEMGQLKSSLGNGLEFRTWCFFFHRKGFSAETLQNMLQEHGVETD